MTSPLTYSLLRYAAVLAFACYVLLQARKPDKWFGKIFARAMNKSHLAMTVWGLGNVTIESRYHILVRDTRLLSPLESSKELQKTMRAK